MSPITRQARRQRGESTPEPSTSRRVEQAVGNGSSRTAEATGTRCKNKGDIKLFQTPVVVLRRLDSINGISTSRLERTPQAGPSVQADAPKKSRKRPGVETPVNQNGINLAGMMTPEEEDSSLNVHMQHPRHTLTLRREGITEEDYQRLVKKIETAHATKLIQELKEAKATNDLLMLENKSLDEKLNLQTLQMRNVQTENKSLQGTIDAQMSEIKSLKEELDKEASKNIEYGMGTLGKIFRIYVFLLIVVVAMLMYTIYILKQ